MVDPLPVPGTTAGPTWANMLNMAISDLQQGALITVSDTITLPGTPDNGQRVNFISNSTATLPAGVTWDTNGNSWAGQALLSFVWDGSAWLGSVITSWSTLTTSHILLLDAGASVPAGTPVGTIVFQKA